MTLLTEEQAKEKWCPFARAPLSWAVDEDHYDTLAAAVNIGRPMICRCQGSDCMAWRWEPSEDFKNRQVAYEDSSNLPGTMPEPLPRGYCGLAGKP